MAMAEEQDKKLIIDEDWKKEAQQEKEVLAAQEEQEKEKQKEAKERRPLPPVSFPGLISVFATQAYLALGILRIKEDEEREPDFEMAKYNIDMLAMLEEKTQGNLSADEKKVLEEALQQLRMTFVTLSK
jgi:hypothetical protein